ncbi:MAG: DUF3536 domain-containing protein [Bacillota bacterium]|nr:DUF3536 domain-containing protein [Bacillota bacterium]
MERSICIHGHFYQPPRENPWLEDIELQDSAYPYHDWNERVTAECYEPNTASRILDGDGWIRNIVNNYARISFNFGPTLLSWMEKKEPEVYRAIIEADLQSRKKFSGHGSAFAQAYNHMILPLANGRDRYTQVVWGIKDFEHRFGRKPEGMWLPETAVDLETLKIMAEQGIKFTVLANYQVKRVRKIDGGEWRDVLPGGADTKMPYVVHLPGTDKTISVFLYDGEVARAVAFEKLLYSGEHFAQRLAGAFDDRREPQLVHIATDGETYGHHHRHGDMALAYALDLIETKGPARLTNYAAYLEQHLPTYEAEINEYTSWSCFHGVERWRNDCGCNSGMHPGWNQAWRRPLRDALDWLRDHLAPQYEEKAARYLKDPWEARNAYIEIILDRSRDNVTRWIEEHAARNLDPGERITVLKLLELQRHAMLMYTSCGWFFDEISGIETVQVIKYAARVVQLARELFGTSPEPRFLEILAGAGSNIPQFKDGANIYHRLVKPAMVDLLKVGAHYAICSLFESYDDHSRIYCYNVHRENYQISLAGRATLSLGRVRVTSEITHESAPVVYGVVYFGNHNTGGGVRYFQGEEAYQAMVKELTGAFNRADFAEVIRLIDHHFEGATYTLRQLFKDKQREVLDTILETTLKEAAADYRRIYDRHVGLIRFLRDLDIPRPKALSTAAEFVLNTSLRRALAGEPLDFEQVRALLAEVEMADVPLDKEGLSFVLEQTLEKMGDELRARPTDQAVIADLDAAVGLVRSLPFEVDLWKVQNVYFRLLQTIYPDFKKAAAEQGDDEAEAWVEGFCELGEKLRIRGCR